jgi:hypothetical protein
VVGGGEDDFFAVEPVNQRSTDDGPPTTFANRYDANFVAKHSRARREIVPNRFDALRCVLLFKRVLSTHVRFTSVRHQVCEGRICESAVFGACQFPLLMREGASSTQERREFMRSLSAANAISVLGAGIASRPRTAATRPTAAAPRGLGLENPCKPSVSEECQAQGQFQSPQGVLMIDQI